MSSSILSHVITSAQQSLSTYFPPPEFCPCPCPPLPLLPPALEPAEAFAFLSPALCALAAKPSLLISLPPVACCARFLSARLSKRGSYDGQRVFPVSMRRSNVDVPEQIGCAGHRIWMFRWTAFSILLRESLECVGIGIWLSCESLYERNREEAEACLYAFWRCD